MSVDSFKERHIGLTDEEKNKMLTALNVSSINELIDQTIPSDIRTTITLPKALTENEYLAEITKIANKNEQVTSFIGMGWYGTVTPSVIYRNVFENPVWYTSYTPYQSEISQGRLEALMNFQTVVSELTALPLSNCSLLDEATAGAEAVSVMHNLRSREQEKNKINKVFIDKNIFPQTKAVIYTRTNPQGIEVVEGDFKTVKLDDTFFGAVLQYPDSEGEIRDYSDFVKKAKEHNIKIAAASDLLSLTILVPPGEWGADIAFGSSQRFGIPLYFGGPSAGFFATKEEYKRQMPGRIIGVSKDAYGKDAFRMALQTREQHIKREKATSNICTAQALLATMSGMYAVYHGPKRLKKIAEKVHSMTVYFSEELKKLGYTISHEQFFDTLKIQIPSNVKIDAVKQQSKLKKINLRYFDDGAVGVSLDETVNAEMLNNLISLFSGAANKQAGDILQNIPDKNIVKDSFLRKSSYLSHPTFNSYHTETEMMRYLKRLERKDISLAHSMIPLGSCTMKLNAATELLPLGLAGLQNVHPLAPKEQIAGYMQLITELGDYLKEITGFDGISFQPNSGAAGEYAGLMTIRAYYKSLDQEHRNIILIPASAHGTNPASAAQAGFDIITVKCDENGNVMIDDLREKSKQNAENLAGLMITYPSTHGIFEEGIKEICDIIHKDGGQVYMDGANMNAQVGITSPGFIGADVCHLNLHKTFAIPHGGGGPGEGPICVAKHLIPFLPHHPFLDNGTLNTVSSSPFGSAGILPISHAYIRMMGDEGLKEATEAAILSANYLAEKLKETFGVVYSGKQGRVGHEMILECRNVKKTSGITETDIAKRLMDFGYHAPTVSFPVAGTLMIEPTESESLSELDRFIDVMNTIWTEIKEVEEGKYSKEDNVLINAPHPQYEVAGDEWKHSYPRSKAAFALPYLLENKFWVNVARIDNAKGDRNLISCLCEMS